MCTAWCHWGMKINLINLSLQTAFIHDCVTHYICLSVSLYVYFSSPSLTFTFLPCSHCDARECVCVCVTERRRFHTPHLAWPKPLINVERDRWRSLCGRVESVEIRLRDVKHPYCYKPLCSHATNAPPSSSSWSPHISLISFHLCISLISYMIPIRFSPIVPLLLQLNITITLDHP